MSLGATIRRPVFYTSHTIDELGIPGSIQALASGVGFTFSLASGTTHAVDRINIMNVAVTTKVATTFRINFFSESSRGGVAYTDSTYVGGLDIATASGCPEDPYSHPGTGGVYYGNAFNTTYSNGVACNLPYYTYSATTPLVKGDKTQGWNVHATIQNLGSTRAAPVKIGILYELANYVDTY